MSANSYLFTQTPLWKRHFLGFHRQPSHELQSWLVETGSLTKRLRSVYGPRLTVRILFHQWKPAFADECLLLNAQHHRYQLIREVQLHVDNVPLVLARTVLPEQTIRVAHRNLSHLGTRPLGEVIFAYPDLERRQRDFSCSTAPYWSADVRREYDVKEALWGRRTVYAIHGQPLLVSEFFLPNILSGSVIQTP